VVLGGQSRDTGGRSREKRFLSHRVGKSLGVGTATAWRYVNETVELLAARVPKLRRAVRDTKKAGYAFVVLDGTLIPIDQVARTARSTPASTSATG
jgi:hypothetical protein